MVPACSDKVPRVSSYSGYHLPPLDFGYGALTPYGRLFQNRSPILRISLLWSEPRGARTTVWALPISLAATLGIILIFSSSGYLDVSVHRVPPAKVRPCGFSFAVTEVCSAGFPHSDICGSMVICTSPQLFAAYYVLLRLSVPRHPPYALFG